MSYVCHLTDQHDPSGETGSTRLTSPPVLGLDGPKEPTSWTHSTQGAVHHEAPQTDISFMPHAVLRYSTSVQLSTSIKTDVSCANISSLPLRVCSAGDIPQPDDQPRDYESAMGGMTLDSASLTGTGKQDIEDMEKNLEVKM